MRLTLTGSWDIDVCGKATVRNPELQQQLPIQVTVRNPALQQQRLLLVTVQNPALLQNFQSKRLCRIQRYSTINTCQCCAEPSTDDLSMPSFLRETNPWFVE